MMSLISITHCGGKQDCTKGKGLWVGSWARTSAIINHARQFLESKASVRRDTFLLPVRRLWAWNQVVPPGMFWKRSEESHPSSLQQKDNGTFLNKAGGITLFCYEPHATEKSPITIAWEGGQFSSLIFNVVHLRENKRRKKVTKSQGTEILIQYLAWGKRKEELQKCTLCKASKSWGGWEERERKLSIQQLVQFTLMGHAKYFDIWKGRCGSL